VAQNSSFQSELKSALLLFQRQQLEQATHAADRATALAAGNDDLLGVAILFLRFGRTANALAVFERMLVNDPNSIVAHSNIAQLQPEHEPAEVATMLDLAHTTDPHSASGILLNFALGKVFADLGDFDRSFDFYEHANADRRAKLNCPIAAWQKLARHIRMAFQQPLFDRLAGAGVRSFKPIFIVGMPRSGSTLIEQILASHRDVHGGDELPLTSEIIVATLRKTFRGSVPDLVATATPDTITEMARAYIKGARPLMGKKPRLADKYLDNFWQVGLIRLMFPEAKVIHCLRDPLDNGVSIYRRDFADPGPTFAYDLNEIGAYYKLHESIMRHWDEVLPGFVHHVRYEDIVTDFEGKARELVAFCGLPWDGHCLAFHRTERPVKTASHAQVRQPVYRDAIGSAQPYLSHLAPLIEALR
jgi:tetratricopeptide (TPR) repeat protein